MFGFEFKINFNYPYISRSITEFWRRWHISLSLSLIHILFAIYFFDLLHIIVTPTLSSVISCLSSLATLLKNCYTVCVFCSM